MFQPQPTPFAASCFNSYASDLSFPLTLQTLPGASHGQGGGSGASQSQQRAAGNHAAAAAAGPPHHAQRQQQQQQRHHPQQHAHHAHPQQSLLYNASASASVSPVASSHGHFSPASSHTLSSPYNHATPPTMDHGHQQPQHESGGLMGDEMAAQEAAAREYQPQLEVGSSIILISPH